MEHPLRLKLFAILYLLDIALTFPMILNYLQQRTASFPPETHFWIFFGGALVGSASLLLIAALWIRNRIAYVVAIIFIAGEVFGYFYVYPNYPTIFLILEVPQLILLLSLINYYFKR